MTSPPLRRQVRAYAIAVRIARKGDRFGAFAAIAAALICYHRLNK